MAKQIKKPILKEMKKNEKIATLLEKGDVQLKIGKNVINVVDDDGKIIRRKVVVYTGDESPVQKSMQDETDIKNILAKFGRTGVAPIMQNEALYGDFSEPTDFHEAQNIISKARQQFELLSSDVRNRFGNDPAKFLQFVQNPENAEEMVKIGIAKKVEPKPEAQPMKVEVVNKETSNGTSGT